MFFPSATRVPFLDFDGKPRAFSRILKTASLCVLSVSGAAALRGGSDENSGGLFERVTRQRARVGARKRGGGCCGAPVSRASGAGGSGAPFFFDVRHVALWEQLVRAGGSVVGLARGGIR